MNQHIPNNVAEQAFTAAKYFYEMSDRFYSLYNTSRKEEHIAYYHQYRLKASEAEKYGELMVQDAIKKTVGFAPEWVRDNFIALNPAQINNEINRFKAYERGDISDAEVIEPEKVEIEHNVKERSSEDLRNEEIAILTKKKDTKEKEPPFITNLRSEMFELIEAGEKEALAKLLSDYHFRWNDYSVDRAFRFISIFKEQYGLREPSKKMKDSNVTSKIAALKAQTLNKKRKKFRERYFNRYGIKPSYQQVNAVKLSREEVEEIEGDANKWSISNIPKDKYIHAEYIVRHPDRNEVEVGYVKRHPTRPMELYKGSKFKCYLDDVLRWRITFLDKDKEFQRLKKYDLKRR